MLTGTGGLTLTLIIGLFQIIMTVAPHGAAVGRWCKCVVMKVTYYIARRDGLSIRVQRRLCRRLWDLCGFLLFRRCSVLTKSVIVCLFSAIIFHFTRRLLPSV